MDQPRPTAPLGHEPIRTISRDELKVKLDRGDEVKLIMALNRWAYEAKHIPGCLHFDTPDELYAAIKPANEMVGWSYHHDRDLTGFIDRTENPPLMEAMKVALIPPGIRRRNAARHEAVRVNAAGRVIPIMYAGCTD